MPVMPSAVVTLRPKLLSAGAARSWCAWLDQPLLANSSQKGLHSLEGLGGWLLCRLRDALSGTHCHMFSTCPTESDHTRPVGVRVNV